MIAGDFFVSTGVGPWGPETALDVNYLDQISRSSDPTRTDLEVAIALARLAHNEFQKYGTSGATISNTDAGIILRALRAVARRAGIAFDAPFSDFDDFRSFWLRNGAHGSWQARRDLLTDLFDPLHRRLDDQEAATLVSTLVDPVSPRKAVGWPAVDEELFELRRHFQSAQSEQDYSNVGNDAVAVLEALSRTVYDHAAHGAPGTDEPAVGNTKDRLTRYIEVSLQGPEGAALRKLARAAVELAQETKHRRSGDRRSAGVAADAVILLANILRRIGPDS